MRAPFEHHDPRVDERQIGFLSDQSGVPTGQVRALYRHELARLGLGAKVGSYLAVLTASNVRGMLRRTTRLADAAHAVQEHNAAPELREPSIAFRDAEPQHLQSWEDDGGKVRRSR